MNPNDTLPNERIKRHIILRFDDDADDDNGLDDDDGHNGHNSVAIPIGSSSSVSLLETTLSLEKKSPFGFMLLETIKAAATAAEVERGERVAAVLRLPSPLSSLSSLSSFGAASLSQPTTTLIEMHLLHAIAAYLLLKLKKEQNCITGHSIGSSSSSSSSSRESSSWCVLKECVSALVQCMLFSSTAASTSHEDHPTTGSGQSVDGNHLSSVCHPSSSSPSLSSLLSGATIVHSVTRWLEGYCGLTALAQMILQSAIEAALRQSSYPYHSSSSTTSPASFLCENRSSNRIYLAYKEDEDFNGFGTNRQLPSYVCNFSFNVHAALHFRSTIASSRRIVAMGRSNNSSSSTAVPADTRRIQWCLSSTESTCSNSNRNTSITGNNRRQERRFSAADENNDVLLAVPRERVQWRSVSDHSESKEGTSPPLMVLSLCVYHPRNDDDEHSDNDCGGGEDDDDFNSSLEAVIFAGCSDGTVRCFRMQDHSGAVAAVCHTHHQHSNSSNSSSSAAGGLLFSFIAHAFDNHHHHQEEEGFQQGAEECHVTYISVCKFPLMVVQRQPHNQYRQQSNSNAILPSVSNDVLITCGRDGRVRLWQLSNRTGAAAGGGEGRRGRGDHSSSAVLLAAASAAYYSALRRPSAFIVVDAPSSSSSSTMPVHYVATPHAFGGESDHYSTTTTAITTTMADDNVQVHAKEASPLSPPLSSRVNAFAKMTSHHRTRKSSHTSATSPSPVFAYQNDNDHHHRGPDNDTGGNSSTKKVYFFSLPLLHSTNATTTTDVGAVAPGGTPPPPDASYPLACEVLWPNMLHNSGGSEQHDDDDGGNDGDVFTSAAFLDSALHQEHLRLQRYLLRRSKQQTTITSSTPQMCERPSLVLAAGCSTRSAVNVIIISGGTSTSSDDDRVTTEQHHHHVHNLNSFSANYSRYVASLPPGPSFPQWRDDTTSAAATTTTNFFSSTIPVFASDGTRTDGTPETDAVAGGERSCFLSSFAATSSRRLPMLRNTIAHPTSSTSTSTSISGGASSVGGCRRSVRCLTVVYARGHKTAVPQQHALPFLCVGTQDTIVILDLLSSTHYRATVGRKSSCACPVVDTIAAPLDTESPVRCITAVCPPQSLYPTKGKGEGIFIVTGYWNGDVALWDISPPIHYNLAMTANSTISSSSTHTNHDSRSHPFPYPHHSGGAGGPLPQSHHPSTHGYGDNDPSSPPKKITRNECGQQEQQQQHSTTNAQSNEYSSTTQSNGHVRGGGGCGGGGNSTSQLVHYANVASLLGSSGNNSGTAACSNNETVAVANVASSSALWISHIVYCPQSDLLAVACAPQACVFVFRSPCSSFGQFWCLFQSSSSSSGMSQQEQQQQPSSSPLRVFSFSVSMVTNTLVTTTTENIVLPQQRESQQQQQQQQQSGRRREKSMTTTERKYEPTAKIVLRIVTGNFAGQLRVSDFELHAHGRSSEL